MVVVRSTPKRARQTCSQKHFQNESYIKHDSEKSLSAESPHEEIRDLATSVGTGNRPQPIHRVTVQNVL